MATQERVQHQEEDIESGNRFRLNTEDDVEPIPNLPSSESESVVPVNNTASVNGSTWMTGTRSSTARGTTQEFIVSPRMSTIEFLWRRHVRSQTNNATIHAIMDRILLIILFLASFMEQPLNYLLGKTSQTPVTTSQRRAKPLHQIVTHGTTKTQLGVVAYTTSQGRNPSKLPILCFHANRRSSDEFFELQTLLAATGRRVVAIDSFGCGWSENPRRSCTIDDMADAFIQVADELLVQKFLCLGSSTGSYIAASLASRYPNRVRGCIFANLLYNPLQRNIGSKNYEKNMDDLSTDPFDLHADGTFLIELHNKYNALDPAVTIRCIQGELSYIGKQRVRREEGIVIEEHNEYDLESAARKIKCPILCAGGEAALANLDARKLGGTQRFDTACRLLPLCEVTTLTGPRSTLHLMNQAPQEFASLCTAFLDKNSL